MERALATIRTGVPATVVAAGIANTQAAVLDGLSGAGRLQGASNCSSRHGARAGILWLLRAMQRRPIHELDVARAAGAANTSPEEHDVR
jgi:hypothetical protein